MEFDLRDLAAKARAVERLERVRRYVATPMLELLAERGKREGLVPPIPVIDEQVDSIVVNYDQEAWRTAVDYYRQFDCTRRVRGIQNRTRRIPDGIRSVTSSDIDDVAEALLRFRKYFLSDFENRAPSLLDMGCFDGRVVVLAYLLGYRAEGIEIDEEGYKECVGIIKTLDKDIPGLERDIHIARGDYTTAKGLRELRTRIGLVDCFFNYDDANVDKVAEVIHTRGKQGAKLLLNTYAEHRHEIPLTLTHMVRTSYITVTKGVMYPTFDVFMK